MIRRGYEYDDVLLVPKLSSIGSRDEVSLGTQFTRNIHLDQPLVAANMDTVCESAMAKAMANLGGIGVIHRYMSVADQVAELKKSQSLAAAAIGVKDYEERIPELWDNGCSVVVLDVAHGHHMAVLQTINWIKKNFPELDVMAGNVVTKNAAKDLQDWGADGIKVGVGPGSHCTTRIQAGAGVPQITAIMDVSEIATVPICADGGIRTSGDIVKALAAGASTVMIGRLFAGANETPGDIRWVTPHVMMKEYRGMASKEAKEAAGMDVRNIEGVSSNVPATGPVKDIAERLLDGVRSGISYVGVRSIEQLWATAEFIEVTTNARHLNATNQ